ncbi:T6SS immunity protein Tli4 family protein [Yersinia intermedia]|uniref:T6SS immunity protein Tli4 family protein n=1 Tax=Yersinia intermedia TaxID=631 RepID=UPI001CFCB87B|nr:T6SS immunity protein Tli4 family protein [Yersinia intermedia]MCB5311140.1 hypothetical protein [Yersinia intermedia]MCB5325970.1 hypothetical protein [Yersinia intermedia]
MIKKKELRYSIAIVSILIVYGIWKMNHGVDAHFQAELTTTENKNVEILLKNMQTNCIGRYLIDLPKSYYIAENSQININESKITTSRIYLPAFEQRVRLREQQLRTTATINPEDIPYLKKTYPLPLGLTGIIFERVESPGTHDAFRVLETHLYSNGVAIKIETEFTNAMADRYENKRKSTPSVYVNTAPERMSELTDLLSRIQGRAEDEVPTTAGTCIPNAFVSDNGKDKEEIDLLFRSDNDSQLRFGVSTDNFTKEKDSLLERSDDIWKNLLSSNGDILRRGVRKINKLDTEELLAAGKYSSNDNKRYDFILLTNEKTGGIKSPVFSLELLNDELTHSPYNQKEIVSFWDAISQTLRVRPGAFSHE